MKVSQPIIRRSLNQRVIVAAQMSQLWKPRFNSESRKARNPIIAKMKLA
jgi:hypothetical protein